MFEFLGDILIKKFEAMKTFCWNNGYPETLRVVKGEYTSYQVEKFITRIYYPPNAMRDHGLTVYIHFIEYMVKKIIEDENLDIKNFNDYKKIYNSVVEKYDFSPEANRFYTNWLRREEFKNARIAGKIGKKA